MADLSEVIATWFSILFSDPWRVLWIAVVPGFIRKLRRYKGLRYAGPWITRFLDSSWAARAEMCSRIILATFILIAFFVSPFIVMSKQREAHSREVKDIQAKLFEVERQKTILETEVEKQRALIPDPRQIVAALQYAYEWNYLGATNEPSNTAREINPTVPLRKKYPAHNVRFDLGVLNKNAVPIPRVRLRVIFPGGKMRVETAGSWTAIYPHREYAVQFGFVEDRMGSIPHPNPLMLSFDARGTYEVHYEIKVLGLEPISGQFPIIIE